MDWDVIVGWTMIAVAASFALALALGQLVKVGRVHHHARGTR